MVLNWFSGGELWKEAAEDAAAGGRLPAPGSEEVFVLDLGASCDYRSCWISFVCCSSLPSP